VKLLSSNSDLYRYLLELAENLRKLGLSELAEIVISASNQAAAMSTEFLGESRIALRRVWNCGRSILTEEARADLVNVLPP
jgi:hypothetical protein